MSLQVWLPLTKDLRNQGLSNVAVTNNGATFDSAGKLGGCYQFDGSNDKIKVANVPNSKDISVAMWFKRNANTNTRQFLYTQWDGITLELASNGTITCSVRTADGQVGHCNSTTAITASSGWNHIVFTFKNGVGTTLYLNGALVTSQTVAKPIQWSTTIGNIGYYSTYFNGAVNDFRIYDHCLSEKEVKEISKGLVLHYPLNNNGYGNENLLKGTKFLDGDTSVTSGVTKTDNAYLGFTSATYDNSSGTSYHELIQWPSKITVNANEVYTASFYAKSPSSTTLTCYFYNNTSGIVQVSSVVASTGAHGTGSDGNITLQLTPEWTKYWITWTFNDTATSATKTLLFRCLAGKTELSVCGVKLEKGNKATKWTPNSFEVFDNSIEYDISGYCNNGTRTGNFSWTDDTPKYQVSTIINSSKIQCITNPITGDDPIFSIGFWFKLKSNISYIAYADLVSFSSSSYSNQPFRLEICGNPVGDDIYWFRGPSGNTGGFKINTSSLVRDTWYYTTLVSEGNKQYSYYINGIKIGSYNGSANSWIPTNIFSIGDGQAGAFNISDVRIYATALSAEDVLELYQQKGYANSFEGNNLIYYEYIQNNDLTQYIDLQTSLVNKTVEVKFQQTPLANRLNTVYGGEDNGDPWNAYGFRFNSSTAYMYLNGNLDTTGVNNGITTPAPDENIHIFRGIHKMNQKSSATLDGEALPVVETIPNKFSTRTALLFATKGLGNPGGLKNNNLDLRIYYFKIWDENNNLTHYLRPCSYNGHTGMWNEINNTFYPNCGKGEFTCGNIIGD